MPIHDWTRVDAGLFHDFHQDWTVSLRRALNAGVLPKDYFALVEQRMRGPIPDVLTLQLAPNAVGESAVEPEASGGGGLAVASSPPQARVVRCKEADVYAGRANRITVRHRHGDIVAVIEIVSPGNKSSRAQFRALVEKTAALIRGGVHVLVVDLFPPTKRDPQGVHRAIWEEFGDDESEPSQELPLTLVSYDAGPPPVAYVENVAPGRALPNMPLFLQPEFYVPAPLEAAFQNAWDAFPEALKHLLEAR